jgi:hypothetical protein
VIETLPDVHQAVFDRVRLPKPAPKELKARKAPSKIKIKRLPKTRRSLFIINLMNFEKTSNCIYLEI